MWREFDDLAHVALALWGRVREGVGKNEGGGTIWRVDYNALRAYLEADGPLVYGYDWQDLIDGVAVVNSVKNGG